jgi:hypothetical protein
MVTQYLACNPTMAETSGANVEPKKNNTIINFHHSKDQPYV